MEETLWVSLLLLYLCVCLLAVLRWHLWNKSWVANDITSYIILCFSHQVHATNGNFSCYIHLFHHEWNPFWILFWHGGRYASCITTTAYWCKQRWNFDIGGKRKGSRPTGWLTNVALFVLMSTLKKIPVTPLSTILHLYLSYMTTFNLYPNRPWLRNGADSVYSYPTSNPSW